MKKITRRDFLKISMSAATVISASSGCKPSVLNLSSDETHGGWVKYSNNPVLGGGFGICFDCFVIKQDDVYRMWFSWRPKKSIALVESVDGVSWSEPQVVLSPNPDNSLENEVNRPAVLKIGNMYHMWYTGESYDHSWIEYATSADGKTWKRMSPKPVMSADLAWEKVAVMCPHVIYDTVNSQYRMWYSGGDHGEPDSIGYAVSKDGFTWEKHPDNPIFVPDKNTSWESYKVTGSFVIQHNGYHYMFYIGFGSTFAQIGLARSKDGISGWKRHPQNPIICPGSDKWDADSVYKPSAIYEGDQWKLWYNGRKGGAEQIGMATHVGEDLGFPKS